VRLNHTLRRAGSWLFARSADLLGVTRLLTRTHESVVPTTKEVAMTISINHIETQPLPASRTDAGELLNILHDTVDAVAELDPDLLHSHTHAGHAVVALAGAARAAAEALGTEPGTTLRTAPGVVVVRDLVAAVSLLELAASRRRPSDPRALQQVSRRASTAHGRLLLAVPTRA
jgi:hypothetical protein